VCRTVHDESKLSSPWYQYAINQMDAVTAATDALNKYLGRCFLSSLVLVCVKRFTIIVVMGH